MCGIVGYTGPRDAAGVLIPALRRLEYRGYDSAGIATLDGSRLEVCKAVGNIAALEALISAAGLHGPSGIAHTRLATHGHPTNANAHPHVDCQSRIAVVHNGIIENYRDLRRALAAEGHQFRSQTDTEVIAHLIERYRSAGLAEAVRRTTAELRGAYAIACIADDARDTLVAVRCGNFPLVIGVSGEGTWLASDIPALLGETREVFVLGDGELAVLRPREIAVRTADGGSVRRPAISISWDAQAAAKAGYPHFMLKEIFEQPDAVRNTMRDRVDVEAGDVQIPELGLRDRDLVGLNRVCLVACGTSWHAALVGKYLMDEFARIPVEIEIASEFRYRRPVVDARVLTVAISQSGETGDTLAALRAAREAGSRVVAICNVVGASLARDTDGVLYTRAGIEIGVASTKAFTAQLTAIVLLALKLGLARGMADRLQARLALKALWEAPELMAGLLSRSDDIREVAGRFVDRGSILYIGRGVHYPMALEGALKLKETSSIHAEGCAGGELKHGPIALIDQRMPVVAITPRGPGYEKMVASIEEVKARGGIVIAVATDGDGEIGAKADGIIAVPPVLHWMQPLLVAPPLQLLAYHLGVLRGCDVDRPQHLAKSVTVE